MICKNNIYVYQPFYNNDENAPIFYRTNTGMNNKINTDIITDNIKEELDKLINKKKIVIPLTKDIFEKIKDYYEELLNTKILNRFELIKDEFKPALFNYV